MHIINRVIHNEKMAGSWGIVGDFNRDVDRKKENNGNQR